MTAVVVFMTALALIPVAAYMYMVRSALGFWPVSISKSPYDMKKKGHKDWHIWFIVMITDICAVAWILMRYFPWETGTKVQIFGGSLIMFATFLIFCIGIFTKFVPGEGAGSIVRYWGHMIGSYGGILLGVVALPFAFGLIGLIFSAVFVILAALMMWKKKKQGFESMTTWLELLAIVTCIPGIAIGILTI